MTCLRPEGACVCAELPTVDCATRLVVLQHPKERRHPLGTVPLLSAALTRVDVHCPVRLDRSVSLALSPPAGAALLFPSEDAQPLESLAPGARPSTLFVLDGTWPQARGLYRQNPWLAEMPHVTLASGAPSRYRIRREPKRAYVSSLEAVTRALRILEPSRTAELEALDDAFVTMIDRRIAMRGGAARHRTRHRPKRPNLPQALVAAGPDTVFVYVELSGPKGGERAPCRLSGLRLGDGATFDTWISVRRPPTPMQAAAMMLPPGALDDAPTEDEAFAAMRVALGDASLYCAWDAAPLALVAHHDPSAQTQTLKSAYRTRHGRGAGDVQAALSRAGLAPVPVALAPRAGARLSNARAIFAHLRREALGG